MRPYAAPSMEDRTLQRAHANFIIAIALFILTVSQIEEFRDHPVFEHSGEPDIDILWRPEVGPPTIQPASNEWPYQCCVSQSYIADCHP